MPKKAPSKALHAISFLLLGCMFRKKTFQLLLAAFSGLILTSGIEADQASLNRLWGELNSKNNFNLNKQSFCFDLNGKVFGQNMNQLVRPASVTKMYTSLWAIDELGFDYRFQTHFAYDSENLFILGGEDSYFVSENLILIIDELNKRGITKLKSVTFDSHFKLNWNNQTQKIHQDLEKILNTRNWSKDERSAFNSVNNYLYENQQSSILKPELTVAKIYYQQEINDAFNLDSLIHYSSPLYNQLKPINMYSNNFYTDNIFMFLGGTNAFKDYMYRTFSADEDEIYFETGSGLGENKTTCALTLRVLKELKSRLRDYQLNPLDIMPVAGMDQGTLHKRFTQNEYNQFISAKTGTLRHTSALAGFINDTENTIFAVFNHTYNIVAARELQNEFVKYYLDNTQKIKLNYSSPNTISIKDIIIE